MNLFNRIFVVGLLIACSCSNTCHSDDAIQRMLYVASPGIRNYVQWGGHGVLVFDIDEGHQFVRRISLDGYGTNEKGKILNIKGICANSQTDRLYISTLQHLICINLNNDKVLWQRKYEFGCDRMSMTPDGKLIYLPSLEKHVWYVVDASTGDELTRIEPKSRAHNTVVGLDGSRAYLAGLGSPILQVVDTATQKSVSTVGPFSHNIRPFTVNGDQSLCFVNINRLLGFEIGDIRTGKMLHRVEVEGFEMGPVKRHGCPSHGVGLTPDESEIWVTDGANERIHFFDNTVLPPKQFGSIKLREQPGWITFSLDGTLGYPSTGEVVDVKSHKIITTLADEEGRQVHSEKLLEIDFQDDDAIRNGDQFGLGRTNVQ